MRYNTFKCKDAGDFMDYIRQANIKDISRLAEIEIFNYRMNFYPIFRNDHYYFADLQVFRKAEEYKRDTSLLLNTFVYDDGVMKGFIVIEDHEVRKLFVEPAFQCREIGSRLIVFAIENRNVCSLWVLEKNIRAIAFYMKHGFSLTDERKSVDDTDEFFVRMRRKK